MANLLLQDVRKIFNGAVVVDRLNLDVKDGEFLVLVGPSGCGKSTTLNMIAGLEDVTSGEIVIGDRAVTHLPPHARNIAMVFQSYALYPHMTVAQNLGFGLKISKVDTSEITRRVGEVARMLGIEAVLGRRPKELSGGQRQRVALGRAMVRKPDIFLFDEPLSNLDAQLRVQMRAELKQLHERLRATVVYVTHDQTEAMTLSTRVVVMNKGAVHQIGAPLDVYERPADRFVAQFIGSPAINLLRCTLVQGDKVWLQADALALRVPPAYQSLLSAAGSAGLLVGFRPEHVHFVEAGGSPVGENEADAVVLLSEPLGPQTQVTVMLGDNRILALAPPGRVYRPRDVARVRFDVDRLHVFVDDDRGRTLLRTA